MSETEVQEIQRKIINLEMRVMKNRQISKPAVAETRELISLRKDLHRLTRSKHSRTYSR